jgi:mannose-6-phosphate isomerase-like protein (cupin superfamily)
MRSIGKEHPMTAFFTGQIAGPYDALAPDGSEIRLLAATGRASVVHCTLPPGGVSLAVAHRTVEEIWYVIGGRGEVWRWQGDVEAVTPVGPGTALTIPTGAHFQFRTTSDAPLQIVIATMPPWPGEEEAERVPDHWPALPPLPPGDA